MRTCLKDLENQILDHVKQISLKLHHNLVVHHQEQILMEEEVEGEGSIKVEDLIIWIQDQFANSVEGQAILFLIAFIYSIKISSNLPLTCFNHNTMAIWLPDTPRAYLATP
ncbi:uncharacterized protein DS421_19g669530 [Arachis hypogaea]|uniref:Uncharacterized protein n=1 Tax=Arachis hypogaea TaxID=3818 RepID=A0A6B9VDA0_ARAHY|nr:uncharacterized protein DS421_19g669530 [Arachis hypogaea]